MLLFIPLIQSISLRAAPPTDCLSFTVSAVLHCSPAAVRLRRGEEGRAYELRVTAAVLQADNKNKHHTDTDSNARVITGYCIFDRNTMPITYMEIYIYQKDNGFVMHKYHIVYLTCVFTVVHEAFTEQKNSKKVAWESSLHF